MSHDNGLQALKDGDVKTAIPLLAKAVQETAYSSDALNDAYTLALYRAGEKTRLAYAAIEIGDSLLQKNPALAMDYFQRAFLGELDSACVRYIGEIYEGWAALKPSTKSPSGEPIKKVAHVMRSSISIMGISTLVPILQEMENLGEKAEDIEKIKKLNQKLNTICKQALEEIEKEKSNYV